MEASLKDLDRAREVYTRVVDRTLGNGTTTASYFATIDPAATKLLADIALQHRQRAFVGRVCMTRHSPDYYIETDDEAAARDVDVVDYIEALDKQGEIVRPIVTPRFAPSCSMETMKRQGKLVQERGLHCQTHVSENKGEIAWVGELFPESANYTSVYDDAGLLTRRTILAHCVHLSPEERQLIRDRGSGVSHCPISNTSITSGFCPVRQLLDEGVRVSLGTDCSGGYSPSVLEVARQALLVSRTVAYNREDDASKLSVGEILYLATLGGAEVCDLQNQLGNFVVGKKFDAQLVDLRSPDSPVDVFAWAPPEKPVDRLRYQVERWFFNGDDRNCRKVWVNGTLAVSK